MNTLINILLKLKINFGIMMRDGLIQPIPEVRSKDSLGIDEEILDQDFRILVKNKGDF